MTINATRQGRLNAAFGKNNRLCFQVFVEAHLDRLTGSQYDLFARKHNIDPAEHGLWRISSPPFGRYKIRDGKLRHYVNGKRRGNIYLAQPIYTSPPHLIDTYQEKIAGDYKNHIDQLHEIANQYASSITSTLPELKVKNETRIVSKNLLFIFRYFIQPYCPSLCHTNDFGKLKPITVIDGHIIEPKISRIDDLVSYRKTHQKLKP